MTFDDLESKNFLARFNDGFSDVERVENVGVAPGETGGRSLR